MILTSILDALRFCKKIGFDASTQQKLIFHAIRRGFAVRNRAWYAKIVAEQRTTAFNLQLPNRVQLVLRTQDMPMLFEIFKREDYRLPIEKSLDESAIVVDLGANIGLASVFFQQNYYPNARFIAVEPSPKNIVLLEKNLASAVLKSEIAPVVVNDTLGLVRIDDGEVGFNVHIIDVARNVIPSEKNAKNAVSRFSGCQKVSYTKGSSLELKTSLRGTKQTNEELKGDETIHGTEVVALTMSKIMEDLHISRIDLLKMDIEGAEKAVLRDAAAWLPKVKFLVVVLHGDYTETDLWSDIEPHGFQVFKANAKHLYFAKRIDSVHT
jgi:FkbM family methyltransferase